jgi:uncharacterized membrane protein
MLDLWYKLLLLCVTIFLYIWFSRIVVMCIKNDEDLTVEKTMWSMFFIGLVGLGVVFIVLVILGL